LPFEGGAVQRAPVEDLASSPARAHPRCVPQGCDVPGAESDGRAQAAAPASRSAMT
jgi:hypothetical protein